MSDKKVENPPAFPKAAFYHEHGGTDSPQEGMSLRDYFAAKAMQGILSNPSLKQGAFELYANDSYLYADAMLKERSKEL